MDLKQLAQHLKELGEAELKKLAAILESDVETDLGITKGGNQVKPFSGGDGDGDLDDGAGLPDDPTSPAP